MLIPARAIPAIVICCIAAFGGFSIVLLIGSILNLVPGGQPTSFADFMIMLGFLVPPIVVTVALFIITWRVGPDGKFMGFGRIPWLVLLIASVVLGAGGFIGILLSL
jgi:hypothetical protein